MERPSRIRCRADRAEGTLAAVVMEPMMLNAGAIAPRPGYLGADAAATPAPDMTRAIAVTAATIHA
jgi:glutamate-1-semialdehyde aminotransferase